jgi:hypothetical protein
MPEVDLREVPNAGAVHFLKAEWQVPRSRFVILRYSMHGNERPLGLRLDLDKVAILDDVGEETTDAAIKSRAKQIWEIVINYRRDMRDVYI